MATLLFSCNDESPVTIIGTPSQEPVDLFPFDFESEPFLFVSHKTYDLKVIFSRNLNGQVLDFVNSDLSFPIIMEDETNSAWNIYGQCVSGVRRGQTLNYANSKIAYWYSWNSTFDVLELNDQVITNTPKTSDDPDWNIPEEFVNVGAQFDGIPAINAPTFQVLDFKECIENYFFLQEKDEVIVVEKNNETKIYPIKILVHHEVINDTVGGVPIVVSYAPYTGSSAVYERVIKNELNTFGVSGLIYNNNLLLFDRATNSLWSQLLGVCIHGENKDKEFKPVYHLLTEWGSWKNAFDNYNLLEQDQGFNKDYEVNIFSDYTLDDNDLPFEASNYDNSYNKKDRFIGVVLGSKARLFKF